MVEYYQNKKIKKYEQIDVIKADIFNYILTEPHYMKDKDKLRADLEFLLVKIKEIHPNPYHVHSENKWEQVYNQIITEWDDYDYLQALGSYFKMIALLNDSHSRILFNYTDNHKKMGFNGEIEKMNFRYPIRYQGFYDGIYINKIASQQSQYLGSKIISIQGIPVMEIYERIIPFLPTENLMGEVTYLSIAIPIPFFLYIGGIISKIDQEIEIETDKGKFTLRPTIEIGDLESINEHLFTEFTYPNSNDHLSFEYDENRRLLYARLAEIQDSKEKSIRQFASELEEELLQSDVEYMVLDIRDNGGGNNFLNQPLVEMLIRNSKINQPGKLWCLINRKTFSAATNLAIDLERQTWTLFAGEPFMATVNHYGDPTSFTLPFSELEIKLSTLYWQNSEPQDNRPSIIPDIPVLYKFTDFANQIDRIIDEIITFELPEILENATKRFTPRMKVYRENQDKDLHLFFPWLEERK